MSICREIIGEAAGREVKEAEAQELLKDVSQRAERLRAKDPNLSPNEALKRAGEEFATQAEFAALAKKRNAILNATRRVEAVDYLANVWKDKPARGLRALLVGTQDNRFGARSSAGTEIDSLNKEYIGGLMADLDGIEGGLKLFFSGAMDDEIARAISQANSLEPKFDGLDPRAVEMGKAIAKWQEVARQNANEAGAFIGKLDGRITKNSHDQWKIQRDKAGWMASAKENFDLPRMLGDMHEDVAEVDGLLERLWSDFADGIHLKVNQPPVSGKGLKGMARSLSKERVIHWKDADAWSRYNKDFGGGTLRESIVHELDRSARATGIMRVFGPDHEMVYNNIVDDTIARMKAEKVDAEAIKKFKSEAESLRDWHLKNMDGSLDVPGNNTLATYSSGVRAVQSMASLGSSVLSSVSDLATMMRGAALNGGSMFEVVGKGLGKLFEGVPDKEKLALYADLGHTLDSLSGKMVTRRFSDAEGARGVLGTMQKWFFTLNLQNRWTDANRSGVAEFLSMNLARNANKEFSKLPANLPEILKLYAIDEGKWNIIRQAIAREDGPTFLTPQKVTELPDEVFSAYLEKGGFEVSPRAIENLRKETARDLRAYFTDQKDHLLITPDWGVQGMLKMGTRKGTPAGEAARFVTQFKSFPLAFATQGIGREYSHGGLPGVAKLMAVTTLMGYVAMQAKDLAKGQAPRPMNDYRTYIAAMQQGGGLGIYGDLLFSQLVDRSFTDAGLSLLGPTATDVLGQRGILDLLNRYARASVGDDSADPGASTLRFVKSNTPFLNLFYTRLALDYYVFWHLQDMANPGSLERMERTMQEQTGREYLVSPSQSVQ